MIVDSVVFISLNLCLKQIGLQLDIHLSFMDSILAMLVHAIYHISVMRNINLAILQQHTDEDALFYLFHYCLDKLA